VFSSHQAIHLLELPKFRKRSEELTDPLDIWCYFLTHAADLDADQLPKTLKVPMVQRAMEVLDMLAKNDVHRERYQARLKWERDQTAFIDEARQEGIERGIERGIEKGIEKGREVGREEGAWIGRIQICQQLLKTPMTPRDQLAALSIEDLQARASALQQQLGVTAG
jgi:predicted transposase/invertase (TIGR01784 family)